MLNGVNRHEWNPATGRCIRMQDMRNAMATFKRNNINAVRTSHYPNRSEWYFLCDTEGIYVMDETNMETHGSWQKDMVDDPEWNIPASRPEWKDCVVDRAMSMFQRDKNHPSILFWSCGNESYAGEDILAMADYFRAQDPGRIVHGDGALGVHGHKFDILFSHSSGGPVSLVTMKKEWIWRAPKPAFWRAPTENDFGCGFPQKSAVWSAVDQFLTCTGMMILEESTEKVSIQYFFSANVMPDLQTSVTYTVYSNGTMDVKARYIGAHGRPQLPMFGLRFSTTHPVEDTTWLGLSGETYPDRFKGAAFGLHSEVPHIPEYLVPQECGNHMNTQYVTFSMGGSKLTLTKLNTPFAFSAIPYTPAQLSQAAHRDELPAPCRTVITLAGAMRGVGGIDTWMTDVEPAYHVSAEKDLMLSFRVIL